MVKQVATPPRAAPGDVLVIAGHHVGEAPQLAEILEVIGEPGHGEHFRVRWESGRETTIYPGSDAVVRHAGSAKGEAMITAFVDELSAKHVDYTVVPHPRTETARAEAKAVGVAPHEVAKTVVVVTDDGFIRAVVPASQRLDLHKLRMAVGTVDKPRLATEAELSAAYPGFELGAVPPFGGPSGDRVVVDNRLAWEDEVVLEAGTHSQSIKLHTRDLLELSGADVADISAD